MTYPTEYVKTMSQFDGKVRSFRLILFFFSFQQILEAKPHHDFTRHHQKQGFHRAVLWMYSPHRRQLCQGRCAVCQLWLFQAKVGWSERMFLIFVCQFDITWSLGQSQRTQEPCWWVLVRYSFLKIWLPFTQPVWGQEWQRPSLPLLHQKPSSEPKMFQHSTAKLTSVPFQNQTHWRFETPQPSISWSFTRNRDNRQARRAIGNLPRTFPRRMLSYESSPVSYSTILPRWCDKARTQPFVLQLTLHSSNLFKAPCDQVRPCPAQ